MLIHPTIDRLRALGLAAMADTLAELQNNPEAAGMPHADWLGLLVDREVTARDNRRLTRRLTSAKLRQVAAIENVDYRTARGLDRSLFQTLATCQWIRDANHPVIQRESINSRRWTQMTRAAVLLLMLLAGCSEEKPKQVVNEAIESPLQNTVISSFDTYPPKPATQEDLDLVASIPSRGCTGR